jgi:hypothetical protein
VLPLFLICQRHGAACRKRTALPGSLTRNAPTTFSFGLRNATRTIDHLIAQHMHPSSADDEFVGMMDYVAESFHDLLVEILGRSLTLTPAGEPSPLARMFHGRHPRGAC